MRDLHYILRWGSEKKGDDMGRNVTINEATGRPANNLNNGSTINSNSSGSNSNLNKVYQRKICLQMVLIGSTVALMFLTFLYYYYHSSNATSSMQTSSTRSNPYAPILAPTTTTTDKPTSHKTTMALTTIVIKTSPAHGKKDVLQEDDKDESIYLVSSEYCRIPNVNPFHTSVVKFFKQLPSEDCPSYNPLTDIEFDDVSQTHSIRVVAQNLPYYVNSDISVIMDRLRCCYSVISKRPNYELTSYDEQRYGFRIGEATCFSKNITLPRGTEFLIVNCSVMGQRNGLLRNVSSSNPAVAVDIYRNIHAIVVKSNGRSIAKMSPHLGYRPSKDDSSKSKPAELKPSVLIFGIDSVSRLNLIRTMPNTLNYLSKKGWVEMQGYTKAGDDDFPNLIPILTGLNPYQLSKTCWSEPYDRLDNCPFIWKDFKNKSYTTAYIEDENRVTKYNHFKFGFFKEPTDYYIKSLVEAAETVLKLNSASPKKHCIELTTCVEHVLKYCTDFVSTLQDTPYFGLFWLSTFTDKDINQPQLMDLRMKQFFKGLSKYLNNTIVIFLSDHGLRWGPMRRTFVGWFEERMPFLHIWVPYSYRQQYPRKFRNLLSNKNRLTSSFDLHMTLKDILKTGDVDQDYTAGGCKQCQSLFEEVSANRSCSQAGITPHWCTCNSDFVIVDKEDTIVEDAVDFVIGYINKLLRANRNSSDETKSTSLCAVLRLKTVVSAWRKLTTSGHPQEYVIVLQTDPGNGIFEVTITYVSSTGTFAIIDTITRINPYLNKNPCTSNLSLLKFCCCKSKSISE